MLNILLKKTLFRFHGTEKMIQDLKRYFDFWRNFVIRNYSVNSCCRNVFLSASSGDECWCCTCSGGVCDNSTKPHTRFHRQCRWELTEQLSTSLRTKNKLLKYWTKSEAQITARRRKRLGGGFLKILQTSPVWVYLLDSAHFCIIEEISWNRYIL